MAGVATKWRPVGLGSLAAEAASKVSSMSSVAAQHQHAAAVGRQEPLEFGGMASYIMRSDADDDRESAS